LLQNPAYRLVYAELPDSLLHQLCKRLFAYVILTVVTLTSCTTSGRTTLPAPESPQAGVQPPSDRISRVPSGRWQFNFDSKTHTYLSTTQAAFRTLDNTESDALTSIVHFTITTDRTRQPVVVSGTVDKAEVRTGSKIGIDSSRIQLPVSFEGSLDGHAVELDLSGSSDSRQASASSPCTNPAMTVLGDIRTLLTTLPQEVTTGLRWTDTIGTKTCNSTSINSMLQVFRSYKVLGDTSYAGSEALIIQRTDSTELNGGGAQGQHEVTLTGSGTGLTTIYVDRQGVLLAINSSQDLALTVTASGRSKHFGQHLEQTVKLLD